MTQRYNKWTQYEDMALSQIIAKQGSNDWARVSSQMKKNYSITKRSGKQCRERWFNYLSGEKQRLTWDLDSNRRLIQLHSIFGNKWTDITKSFQGKCDNNVKNHFYAIIRKGIRAMCKHIGWKTQHAKVYGIKPNTLSQVFFMGGRKQSEQAASSHSNSLPGPYTLDLNICRQITGVVTYFILSSKASQITYSEQQIRWALERLLEINEKYQNSKERKGSSSENSIFFSQKSSSQKPRQLKKHKSLQDSMMPQDQFEELNQIIKKRPDQSQIQDESSSPSHGIFSQKRIEAMDRQQIIRKCETANFLQYIHIPKEEQRQNVMKQQVYYPSFQDFDIMRQSNKELPPIGMSILNLKQIENQNQEVQLMEVPDVELTLTKNNSLMDFE